MRDGISTHFLVSLVALLSIRVYRCLSKGILDEISRVLNDTSPHV